MMVTDIILKKHLILKIFVCTVLILHLNMDLACFVGCCFSCGCCGTNALQNAVRVYPETVQGLMFYRSKG